MRLPHFSVSNADRSARCPLDHEDTRDWLFWYLAVMSVLAFEIGPSGCGNTSAPGGSVNGEGGNGGTSTDAGASGNGGTTGGGNTTPRV